jgi:hypothetical protein
MMGLSYFVIISATGILNFAQGEWMMLSAMLGAALVTATLPYPLAVVLSIAGATSVSLLAERLVIRPLQARNADINIMVVALLGILVVVRYSTGLVFGRAEVRLDGPFPAVPIVLGDSLFILPQTLVIFAVTAATFVALWMYLYGTTFGRSFRIAAMNSLYPDMPSSISAASASRHSPSVADRGHPGVALCFDACRRLPDWRGTRCKGLHRIDHRWAGFAAGCAGRRPDAWPVRGGDRLLRWLVVQRGHRVPDADAVPVRATEGPDRVALAGRMSDRCDASPPDGLDRALWTKRRLWCGGR